MPAKTGRNSPTPSPIPFFCASTYTFPDTASVIEFIEQKLPREEYGRYGNPSEKVVERKLAALDGGESAVLFSSGMAAIVGLLMAKLSAGDEVVFFDECYHRSREFCAKHLSRFGVVTREVPACDYDAMEAAITPQTRLLVSESPTNPHLSVVDLERFAALGKRHGVETLIDATLATPLQRAADRGGHRLRAALGHQVSGGPQRPVGRRDRGHGRQAGTGPQTPRHHGQRQLAAQHLTCSRAA